MPDATSIPRNPPHQETGKLRDAHGKPPATPAASSDVQHDGPTKDLVCHPAFLAAFVGYLTPWMHTTLGREQPFDANAVVLVRNESQTSDVAAATPRYEQRIGDISAMLVADGRAWCMLAVEVQSRYARDMDQRMLDYAADVRQQARMHTWAEVDIQHPLPVWTALIHTGTVPWFDPGGKQSVRGTWLPSYTRDGFLELRLLLVLDLAAWHAKDDAELRAIRPRNLVELFILLEVVRRRTLNLTRTESNTAALAERVQFLGEWTDELLIAAPRLIEAADPSGTYKEHLVRWLNTALMPRWRDILRNDQMKDLAELEDNAMTSFAQAWNALVAEAREKDQAAFREAGLAEGRAEGRAEGLAEGLVEGRAEGLAEGGAQERVAALLDMALWLDVFTDPGEQDTYRVQLQDVSLDQLPTLHEFREHLQSFEDGPARQEAGRQVLDSLRANPK